MMRTLLSRRTAMKIKTRMEVLDEYPALKMDVQVSKQKFEVEVCLVKVSLFIHLEQ